MAKAAVNDFATRQRPCAIIDLVLEWCQEVTLVTGEAPRTRRPYVHRDTRYVSEFVAWAFPDDSKLFNVRLGMPPLEIRQRYPELDVDRWMRVWDKTADALVVTSTDVVVIEGELRRPVTAIGELLIYRSLVRETPSLSAWWRLPIRTVLLTPLPDVTIEPVLRELRIEMVQYRPLWVEQYLREVGRL